MYNYGQSNVSADVGARDLVSDVALVTPTSQVSRLAAVICGPNSLSIKKMALKSEDIWIKL